MNMLLLSGRLTADPETRTAGEHQVITFNLAVNQGESALFLKTEIWNRPQLTPFLHKGMRVLVRGFLKQDRWETAEGDRRERFVFAATQVEFLDPPARSTVPSPETGARAPRPATTREATDERSAPHHGRRPRRSNFNRGVQEAPAAYAGHSPNHLW